MPLNNFGRVRIGFFRSAEPDKKALEDLKVLGVDTIVQLDRGDISDRRLEQDIISNVIYHPISSWTVDYDACIQLVHKIKGLLDTGHSVLVHCAHGRDRTGMIVGMYRLIYDGWTLDQVNEERRLYGVKGLVVLADLELGNALRRLSNQLAEDNARITRSDDTKEVDH